MALQRLSAVIAGVGHYVPETIVRMEEVEARTRYRGNFSLPPGIITSLTGVREKRSAVDGEHPSDLALKAARVALNQAGLRAAEIDLLIFASCAQDLAEPATANILQEKLGASKAHVLDVKNACNSFLNAIDIVDSLIQTGKSCTALIACGEVFSPVINWDLKTRADLEVGFAGLTLGDGAGAVVLRAAEEGERGIQQSAFESDGSQWRLASVRGGGTVAPRDPMAYYFTCQSTVLLHETISRLPPVVKRVLEKSGWRADEVDLICCHQVSLEGIQQACRLTGLPLERCVITIPKYGNTGAASVPIGLSEASQAGRITQGSRLLLVGLSAGISVGAISLVW
jgi:3-oxoacyl-[acyl-carrier-protein] synthase-3